MCVFNTQMMGLVLQLLYGGMYSAFFPAGTNLQTHLRIFQLRFCHLEMSIYFTEFLNHILQGGGTNSLQTHEFDLQDMKAIHHEFLKQIQRMYTDPSE